MAATIILTEGRSGSGKSTAWENVPAEESVVITPNGKDMPFQGAATKFVVGRNKVINNQITALPTLLKLINDTKPEVKYILVDDFTHYFNSRLMSPGFIARKMGNDAFAKWNELAADTLPVITGVVDTFRDDLFIVFNAHTSMNDDGIVSLQTPGKLLENSINIVSYFTYVFHTDVSKQADGTIKYQFLTNYDGTREAKTPKGCFKNLYIPNDYSLVFDTIKTYQGKS